MRKISAEEINQLMFKSHGRSSNVFNAIFNMKPGEHLQIDKQDWEKRYSISRVCSYIAKRNKRKYTSVSIVSQGWIVSRIS